MRRRFLLLLLALLVLAGIGVTVLRWLATPDRMRGPYHRIQLGMTRAEVEGPAGAAVRARLGQGFDLRREFQDHSCNTKQVGCTNWRRLTNRAACDARD